MGSTRFRLSTFFFDHGWKIGGTTKSSFVFPEFSSSLRVYASHQDWPLPFDSFPSRNFGRNLPEGHANLRWMNSVSPILIVRFSHGKGVLFLRESAARVRHAVKVAQWNVFLLQVQWRFLIWKVHHHGVNLMEQRR